VSVGCRYGQSRISHYKWGASPNQKVGVIILKNPEEPCGIQVLVESGSGLQETGAALSLPPQQYSPQKARSPVLDRQVQLQPHRSSRQEIFWLPGIIFNFLERKAKFFLENRKKR
jgi:hypothetical protein